MKLSYFAALCTILCGVHLTAHAQESISVTGEATKLFQRTWGRLQLPLAFELSQKMYEAPPPPAPTLEAARKAYPSPPLASSVLYKQVEFADDFAYQERTTLHPLKPEEVDDKAFFQWNEEQGTSYFQAVASTGASPRAVIHTVRPTELSRPMTPKKLYDGLYNFLGPGTAVLHPDGTLSVEPQEDGSHLIKMELPLKNGERETHWISFDGVSAIPVPWSFDHPWGARIGLRSPELFHLCPRWAPRPLAGKGAVGERDHKWLSPLRSGPPHDEPRRKF